MTAVSAYTLSNFAGNAALSTGISYYVSSADNRRSALSSFAIAAICKLVSLVLFETHAELYETEPHPISGISYPSVAGILSANIVAAVGDGDNAKSLGKCLAVVSSFALDILGASIVYGKPSKMLQPNSVCIEKSINGAPPTLALCNNSTLSNSSNPHDSCPGECIKGSLSPSLAVSEGLALAFIPGVLSWLAFKDTNNYATSPLERRMRNVSPANRVKKMFRSLFPLVPLLAHLGGMKFSDKYKVLYLTANQSPFLHIPYVLPVLFNAYASRNRGREVMFPGAARIISWSSFMFFFYPMVLSRINFLPSFGTRG